MVMSFIDGHPSVYWLKKIDEFLNSHPDEIYPPIEIMTAIGINTSNYRQFLKFIGPNRIVRTIRYQEVYIGTEEKIASFKEEYKHYLKG